MNQELVKKLKKRLVEGAVLGLVLAMNSTQEFGLNTILAAQVTQNVTTAQQAATTGNNIKLTGVADEGTPGYLLLSLDIERSQGIPDGANVIQVIGTGKVTLNGKEYIISTKGQGGTLTKTSNTTAKSPKHYAVCYEADGKTLAKIKASQLKGNTIQFTTNEVSYFCERDIMSAQAKECIKKAATVKGIPFSQGNIPVIKPSSDPIIEKIRKKEEKNRPKNVLPSKGMNIPFEDTTPLLNAKSDANEKERASQLSQIVLDNVGFIDGELHMRIKLPKNARVLCEPYICNSNGQSLEHYRNADYRNGFLYMTYKVKNAGELSSCKIETTQDIRLLSEKASKAFTWKI